MLSLINTDSLSLNIADFRGNRVLGTQLALMWNTRQYNENQSLHPCLPEQKLYFEGYDLDIDGHRIGGRPTPGLERKYRVVFSLPGYEAIKRKNDPLPGFSFCTQNGKTINKPNQTKTKKTQLFFFFFFLGEMGKLSQGRGAGG